MAQDTSCSGQAATKPADEPCSPTCSDSTNASSPSAGCESTQTLPPSPKRSGTRSNPSTPRTPRSTRAFSSDGDHVPSEGSLHGSSCSATGEAAVLRQQLANALARLAAAERQRDAWQSKYREAVHKVSAMSQRYEGLARYIAIALNQRHEQHRSRVALSRTPRLRAIHEASAAEAAAVAWAAASEQQQQQQQQAQQRSASPKPCSSRACKSPRPKTPPSQSPRAQASPEVSPTGSPEASSDERPTASEQLRSEPSTSKGGSSSVLDRAAASMPALLPPMDCLPPCEEDELEQSLLEELQRCAERVGSASPHQRLATKAATRPYALSLIQSSSLGASGSIGLPEDGLPNPLEPEPAGDDAELGCEALSPGEAATALAAAALSPTKAAAAAGGSSPHKGPRFVASAVSPFAAPDAAAPLEQACGVINSPGSGAARSSSMRALAEVAARMQQRSSGGAGSSRGGRGNGSDSEGEEAEHWSMQQPHPPTAEEVERARRRIARRWSDAIADCVGALEPWAGALQGLPLAASLKEELRVAWEEQQVRQQEQQQQQQHEAALTWWDVGKDMAGWAQGKVAHASAGDVVKTVAVTGLAVWGLSYVFGPRRKRHSSLLY